MTIPVDVTFRGMDPSSAVRSLVEAQVNKLERYRRDILRCHVVVERPRHRERGNPYHVTVYLSLPGEDIVLNHDTQIESDLRRAAVEERVKSTEVGMQAVDINVAVTEAFRKARRRLEDSLDRRRGNVKSHADRED